VSTSALLLVDLLTAVACAAAWAGAAVVLILPAAPRQRFLLRLSVSGALLLFVGQCLTAGALAARAWPLAEEKVDYALPVQLLTACIAIALAVPALRGRPLGAPARPPALAGSALVLAAAGAISGVIARVLVGYPFTALAALVLTALVLLAGVVAYCFAAPRSTRERTGAAALIALVAVVSVGYAWLDDVARPGALAAHAHAASSSTAVPAAVSVADLRTPTDASGTLRRFELTARHQTVTAASGATVDAWTFGSLPGPELRVTVGEVVEVTLHNSDIAEGVTIHWHGYDVPNGEDGVAGATQDAVMPGESFEYRFVADEPGTYWYHTHQSAADGIRRGLYGSLIVLPAEGVPETADLTVPVHTFGGAEWLGDSDVARIEAVAAGETVRLRLINTDQLPRTLRLTGTDFLLAAVDGRDLLGPTPVHDEAIRVPAGGRVDLTFTLPPGGALLSADATTGAAVGIGPAGSSPLQLAVDRGAPEVDLLSYGERSVDVPTSMRDEVMVLDQLPRFLGGIPANAYTVNGSVFPHIDSIEVSEGEIVRLTVVNRGRDTHPMHIHGHHVLVLSRDGVAATGAALWLDTFDVQPGEVWQVMLIADNPGIWMDHCHNLDHASEGMMMALTYRGVFTPYDHEHITG